MKGLQARLEVRSQAMDGQKRVSDGSLAEWIKEVEADAPDEGQPAGKNKTAGVKKPCSPTLQPAGKVNDGTTRYEATDRAA
jgi:hypothetical protein